MDRLALDLESYKGDNERLREELKEAKLQLEESRRGGEGSTSKAEVLRSTELAIQIDQTREQMKDLRRTLTSEFRARERVLKGKIQSSAFDKKVLKHENRRLKYELRTKVWQGQWDAAVTENDNMSYEKDLAEKRVQRELMKRERDLEVVENRVMKNALRALGRELQKKEKEVEELNVKLAKTETVSGKERAKVEKELSQALEDLEKEKRKKDAAGKDRRAVVELEKDKAALAKAHEKEIKELSKNHEREVKELTKSVERLTGLLERLERDSSKETKKSSQSKAKKRVEIADDEPDPETESEDDSEPIKPPPKKRTAKDTVASKTKAQKKTPLATLELNTSSLDENKPPMPQKKRRNDSSTAEDSADSQSSNAGKKKKRLLGKSTSSLFSFDAASSIENTNVNTYGMPTMLSPIKPANSSSSSLLSDRVSHPSRVFGGGRMR